MNESARARYFYPAICVAFSAGFLLAILVATDLPNQYRQLNQQLPTFANLQSASIEIERLRHAKNAPDASTAQAILERYFKHGRDVWGNKILYLEDMNLGRGFLLVSPGSDHKLDVRDPMLYFTAKPRNIIGQLERDIIFRNGEAVTDAGKI